MKYFVSVDREDFLITVRGDGALVVARPGHEDEPARVVEAELVAVDGSEKALVMGLEARTLSVRRVGPHDFDVLWPGQAALSCHVLDEQSRILEGDSLQQGALSIKSPMPGIVLDVRVSEGDSVAKGDVLLILEAMKTENEICAELDGIVMAVHIQAQQTIQDKALLIELEEAAGPAST